LILTDVLTINLLILILTYLLIKEKGKFLFTSQNPLIMNIAIISSVKDPASINIKNNLIDNFNFIKLNDGFNNNDIFYFNIDDKIIKLFTVDSELIHTENIDKKYRRRSVYFCIKAQGPGI